MRQEICHIAYIHIMSHSVVSVLICVYMLLPIFFMLSFHMTDRCGSAGDGERTIMLLRGAHTLHFYALDLHTFEHAFSI